MNSRSVTLKRWLILTTLTVFALTGLLGVISSIGVKPVYAESVPGTVNDGVVAVIKLEGAVDPIMESYVRRAIEEAKQSKAELIVFEMNTPGGRLDSAEALGLLISESPIPTVVYVNGKAASAGSYIALSADKIAMTPTSMIGSAAIVDVNAELVDNPKVVAAWSSLMKGAAEANGRDGTYAVAMVDVKNELKLPKLDRTKKAGEVLALDTKEAIKVGYADFEAASLQELLTQMKRSNPLILTIEVAASERVASFLMNPVVATVLLFIGIAGIAIELIVPGFGVPGILGVLSFGLYFFGAYVAGLAGMEAFVLFILGLVLLVLELFVPSFGILGILGSASLITSVVRAAYDTSDALLSLGIAFIAATVVVVIIARIFKHRGVWNRFILREQLTTEDGFVSARNASELIGEIGVALTTLRPSGTASFNERKVDVVTDGGFISAGKRVKVIHVEGVRVVVHEHADD
ncbi:S49 family peptidase [Paenibacillus sp. SC116]|uniref:NfeD family protein n=1 Tax=Paenibacillus sp. SC116 TaxID=2968986 RepID=UPI00215B442C|nr:NfeD family protein [Paenibacillus sp. SC116]MCR8845799.1 S49 family peptidase [Paenibacillus sp. SC116]